MQTNAKTQRYVQMTATQQIQNFCGGEKLCIETSSEGEKSENTLFVYTTHNYFSIRYRPVKKICMRQFGRGKFGCGKIWYKSFRNGGNIWHVFLV